MDQSFDSNDFLQNVSKRRRILPPVLDGRVRGLPTEDELWPEDDENWIQSEQPNHTLPNWWEHAGVYKDANVLLHQVHVEHQLRTHQTSASSTHGSSSPRDQPSQSSNVDSRHLGRSSQDASDPESFDQRAAQSSSREHSAYPEEPNIVRSRYEEHNRSVSYPLVLSMSADKVATRFLGSIVRRRMEEHGNSTSH